MHEMSEQIPTAGSEVCFAKERGKPATVILVRHGETADTKRHTFAGGLSLGLSLCEAGQQQAQRAAKIVSKVQELWGIKPPTLVVHSPMIRAKETGAYIAQACAVDMREESLFRECEFGVWENMVVEEVAKRWPREYELFLRGDYRPEGGESMVDIAARVNEGLQKLAMEFAGQTVVVAAHAVVVRVALGLLCGTACTQYAKFRVPAASVSIVDVWPSITKLGYVEGGVHVAACPSEVVAHFK